VLTNSAAIAATIAISTRLIAFMYSPSRKGLVQRVIAMRDATVTAVVADLSRYCSG
jgi:hypothetical protein